jgi:hypothetical protein
VRFKSKWTLFAHAKGTSPELARARRVFKGAIEFESLLEI